jgi:hypothetical protein
MVDGLNVPEPEETLRWIGEITSAIFLVPIPADAPLGQHSAAIHIFIGSLRIAALKFVLEIGPASAAVPLLNFIYELGGGTE